MTSSPSPDPARAGATREPAGDPSMEDILASIRRILSEEEAQPAARAAPAAAAPVADDVLILDTSMMVAEPPEPSAEPPVEPRSAEPSRAEPQAEPPPTQTALVAPEAAAAAASAVGDLVRRLAAERSMQVHASGPTIEDVVRAEIRPLLKNWLDTHLPPLVERLVRTEIERVVNRAAP